VSLQGYDLSQYPANSDAHRDLVNNVVMELAYVLQIGADRIAVTSLESGSIIVKFKVRLQEGEEAQDLVAAWSHLVRTTGSQLYNTTILRHADPNFCPIPNGCHPPPPAPSSWSSLEMMIGLLGSTVFITICFRYCLWPVIAPCLRRRIHFIGYQWSFCCCLRGCVDVKYSNKEIGYLLGIITFDEAFKCCGCFSPCRKNPYTLVCPVCFTECQNLVSQSSQLHGGICKVVRQNKDAFLTKLPAAIGFDAFAGQPTNEETKKVVAKKVQGVQRYMQVISRSHISRRSGKGEDSIQMTQTLEAAKSQLLKDLDIPVECVAGMVMMCATTSVLPCTLYWLSQL